jgi:hypothetical protein
MYMLPVPNAYQQDIYVDSYECTDILVFPVMRPKRKNQVHLMPLNPAAFPTKLSVNVY